MSGSSGANNSWTILTPEETVAETLRPLAEGTEHHGESIASGAGSGADHHAEGSPVESQMGPGQQTDQLSGDTSSEQQTHVLTTDVMDASETSKSFAPGSDVLSHSEGLPETPTQSSPDPDSFSDSYTHISSSPDGAPVSLLSTDTLEGGEFLQEEEGLTEEATLHMQNEEELQQEGTSSDLPTRIMDSGKLADSPVDSERRDEKTGEEDEPEVKRRRSLLAALERIGRTEEEEEVEEDFQLPRRDEGSGFSVNKCILGAVILLGLGTIFFSGFLMDLDEESDYNGGTRELKDSELTGKQEWLNPDVPPAPVGADSTEMLNKISVLQAQLQTQKEELKVAQGQAAGGAMERLRWEEVEKENSRLKTEMASFPVLQKENERMKKELESVMALHKELETLRSTVTELKVSSAASEATAASMKPTTSPPSGQREDAMQDTAGGAEKHLKTPWDKPEEKKRKDAKKDKYDTGQKKEKESEKSRQREGERKNRKDSGSEQKAGKHEQGKVAKERDKEGKQRKHSDETKRVKEKEWKKEKASRGDEGKPWKTREGEKEWKEKRERKEVKEEKDWKKAKHRKEMEDKQWKDKEQRKDWKGGNDKEEGRRGKEEWKEEKERKKMRDDFKENGKKKWEKNEWKGKEEKKEWKAKNEKDREKEGKGKGERKHWEESDNRKDKKKWDERKQRSENEWKGKKAKDDKEWKNKGERQEWEKKEDKWKRDGQKEKWSNERKKDGPHSHKDKSPKIHDHGGEHVWGDRKPPHTHRRPALEEPEYWVQQRVRLQRNPKPSHCSSLEGCAQAEGLLPVPRREFEAILHNYLSKAEEAGVDASITEELRALTAEFFKDGLFAHDQMSFHDFVEDVSDILENMVEGDEEEEEEDSTIEEEMEAFEREVVKKFSAAGAEEQEDGVKGEWRKESGRGRG